MKKVTGLGGIFFKCNDPENMKNWYKDHLGLPANEYGVSFEWRKLDAPEEVATTQWCVFEDATTYFQPSEKQFMINYRVENLEALLEVLKSEGVTQIGEMEAFDYGKFAWILDPEGNKIELWEPID